MYDKNKVYGVFCGSEVPEVIQSVGTELYVYLKSDTDTNEREFMANYSILKEGKENLIWPKRTISKQVRH